MSARARFTLQEIQAHAVAIVDRDGVAGLSMRTLAASLGTGPMTLYNYVSDRHGLEQLVVDAVTASVRVPRPSDDWEHDVRRIGRAMWTAFRAHPSAIPLVLTRRTADVSSYRTAEALVAALERGGLSGAELLAAFRTVLGFVMGVAQAELAGPLSASDGLTRTEAAARVESLAHGAFPHLAGLARIGQTVSARQEFEGGMSIILQGLRR